MVVVSFCRATFKLDPHMVSVSLHAMFGGYAQGFRARHLKDRSFKFSVASKLVGFEIYNVVKWLRRSLKWFLISGIMVVQIGLEKRELYMLSLIKNGR